MKIMEIIERKNKKKDGFFKRGGRVRQWQYRLAVLFGAALSVTLLQLPVYAEEVVGTVQNIHMTDADGILTQAEVNTQIQNANVGDAPFTVTFADNITTIAEWAFESCSGLTGGLDLNNVTTIDQYAFVGCSGLNGELNMPNVVSVGNSAFKLCSNLTGDLNLPKATTIAEYAFYECSLEGVTLSEVTSIGNYAFNYCSKLMGDLDLPKVTTIGEGAFQGCSGLDGSVNLPALTRADLAAFGGVTNIKNITIDGLAREVVWRSHFTVSDGMAFTIGSDIILKNDRTITIEKGGTFTNNGVIDNDLVYDFGKIINNNGTIQGSGTVNPRLQLQGSDFNPTDQSVGLSGAIELQNMNLFALPDGAGTAAYSIVAAESTGEGSISNTVLTVAKPGTFTIKLTTAEGKMYEAFTTGTKAVLTVKKTPTAADFTMTPPTDLEYDGQEKTATVNVNNGITGMGQISVSYKQNSAAITGNPTENGTYGVYISVAEGDAYMELTEAKVGEFAITYRTLTITAADKTAAIGSAVPELDSPVEGTDYTVTGLLAGDSLTTAPTLAYQTTPDMSQAGTYVIIPSGAAADAKYTIVYKNGTLTVKTISAGGGNGGGSNSSGGSQTKPVKPPVTAPVVPVTPQIILPAEPMPLQTQVIARPQKAADTLEADITDAAEDGTLIEDNSDDADMTDITDDTAGTEEASSDSASAESGADDSASAGDVAGDGMDETGKAAESTDGISVWVWSFIVVAAVIVAGGACVYFVRKKNGAEDTLE